MLTFLLFLLLKVQERLSIVQNKKAEEDLLGLKQKEALEHLTHNLPQVTVYTLTHTIESSKSTRLDNEKHQR